ncbi:MAG: hypothetical protein JXR96_14520, partial [Deltaproteobacteria bacterium]|nr:hypothetical protein [Deltaproteobacteria bacterium]
MRTLLARFFAELRGRVGPAFWAALCLGAALALALAFVPLFDLLAYEFCAVLSLLISATAGPVAIGALRRKATLGQALVLCGLTLVVPLLIISLNALRVQNCNFATGLAFFGLLPAATCLICGLWGAGVGLVVGRRFLGGLAYAGLWLGVAAWSLWQAWSGLEVDSYNQLVGWVAGPIYDSVVEPGWPLVACRAEGLAWAAAFYGLAAFAARRPRRLRRLAVSAAAAAIGLGFFSLADDLGYGRSEARLEAALPGLARSEHFAIHHAEGLGEEEVALLVQDHEFRYAQIERQLGPQDLPPIHSYVFPNAGLKRRLVGAGRTQYAKPWRAAMCLNGSQFPHPTLKHELVHVYAGAFGAWPFAVSARAGLWVNAGLTEGLAVGLDWSAEGFDRHAWSAALRRIDKAPDIRSLFDPMGFWTAAAGRSYTLAGSFVRYLLDEYGPEPLIAAYRDGRIGGHYPKDLEGLIAGWQAFLDAIELDEGTLAVARARFSQPSIFSQTCAHEIAALRSRAVRRAADESWDQAESAIAEIQGHLPGDPASLRLRLEILFQRGRTADALELASELLGREDLDRATKAGIAGRTGDLLAGGDSWREASAHYERVLAAHLSDASDRTALVKLEALARMAGGGEAGTAAGRKVLDFLRSGELAIGTLLELHEAALAVPDWGAAWYLVGRQLVNRERFGQALPYLERAADRRFVHPALAVECMRLRVQALYRCGESEQALALLGVLARFPRHAGDRLWALEWIERIRFDAQRSPPRTASSDPRCSQVRLQCGFAQVRGRKYTMIDQATRPPPSAFGRSLPPGEGRNTACT